MNTKRKRSVIKKQTEKDAFVAILILMIGIFGAIMALIHTAAQDWNQLLVHYENSGLTRYNGQCTQTFVRENMRYRSSSADSIYLELVNGVCVEIGTDCLDGALAGQLTNKSYIFYYLEVPIQQNLKNPFNTKEPIYPLVSIDSTGFNENMAQEIIASWKEAVRIYNAVTLGLLVVVLFFSSMLVRELLPERISKKDSEKLVLREKRKAERRAKYLEERQRQREAKQKKKH